MLSNAAGEDRRTMTAGRSLSLITLMVSLYFVYTALVISSKHHEAKNGDDEDLRKGLVNDYGQAVDALVNHAGPCDKYKGADPCNSDSKCVWCVSYAIPSACYDVDTAKNLPNPVFVCGKQSAGQMLADGTRPTSVRYREEVPTLAESKVEVELVATSMEGDDALCDPVKQMAGYLRLPSTRKNYFYWFFESRSNPSKDPVVLWLTGGPGCSSSLALFTENGPCTVDPATLTTKTNKYSWNNNANLIFVDQPSGTGFSYGGENDHNERDVGRDMYLFVTEFMRKNPQYKDLPFYIFGESYAGHYVPASAHRIWLGNKRGESDIKINLKGLSVGNGMTNPLLQFPEYPEFAYNFTTSQRRVSLNTYKAMQSAMPKCTALIALCNAVGGAFCDSALSFCGNTILFPVEAEGWNQYDLRIKCAVPPLCYDFSHVGKYLNKPEVRAKLNVPKSVRPWETCSGPVNRRFSKDWMHNFDFKIPELLNDNIPVLIYAGDCDFICNWMGNRRWTQALKWKGGDQFRAAKDMDWNNKAGKLRTFGPFSFLRVYQAGHMVPTDQPKNSLDMLNQFISKGSLKDGTTFEEGTAVERK